MKIDLWPVGNSPGFVTKLLITDYNTTSTEISKFKILIFGNAIVFKKMVFTGGQFGIFGFSFHTYLITSLLVVVHRYI
jgi:hypothetical protein